ncbi:hypothetical protein GCM10012319_04180 [Comamonas sp. KCTC 72670]|nr:hypothetical protein GCM10012319_04180 [Comamonas sp. KCTC 72670]
MDQSRPPDSHSVVLMVRNRAAPTRRTAAPAPTTLRRWASIARDIVSSSGPGTGGKDVTKLGFSPLPSLLASIATYRAEADGREGASGAGATFLGGSGTQRFCARRNGLR